MKGFIICGKGILIIGTIGIFFAVFQSLSGHAIIPGMTSIQYAIQIVGSIAIILIGAFPLVYVLSKALEKPLKNVSAKRGIKSCDCCWNPDYISE